jgi:uncharacterized membrane protein YgcG
MYTSPRNARGSPLRKQLPEGPIHDFATVIESTQPEDWQRRVSAFTTLVATIPSGSDYSAVDAWFNSPPTLRHLANPLSALLKDARSTVVKRTCEACSELFGKCQADARYLLKDIMPTVLAVHAQTVKVIQTYVQTMILEALGVVPCKMAMPVWLDRLKSDKSRTVREACALYLGVGLSEWTESGYITPEIWTQASTALVKALKDSAPAVRQNAKRSLEIVHQQQPGIFDRLLEDPSSSLIRDMRTKKLLYRIQAGETVGDDVSVASSRVGGGGSVASRSYRGGGGGGGGGSVSGMRNARSPGYAFGRASGRATGSNNRNHMGIPKTIGVTTSPPPSSNGPTTTSTTTATATTTRGGVPPRNTGGGGGLGPPVRVTAPFRAAVESPPKVHRATEPQRPSPIITRTTTNGSYDDVQVPDPTLSASFDTADTLESELPVIASSSALREFAKAQTRNSRRSSILQERFARSNTNSNITGSINAGSASELDYDLDDILDKELLEDVNSAVVGDTASSTNNNNNVLPEHTRIAQALLEAHKKHVDYIMETLKVEMDTLKEFELVVLEEGPRRPAEEEVLEYFESVGLCLEQRTKAGSILQKKMDKISKGV